MESPTVSYFENIKRQKTKDIAISEIFNFIRSGLVKSNIESLRKVTDQKVREKIKQGLPAITVSGTFTKRHSQIDFLQHSGLIQIDFDHVPDIIHLKQLLSNDIFTFCTFISPTGQGVKAIVKINPNLHKETFTLLQNYYLEKYCLPIDEKCKDMTRLMFLSYDEGIFVNENSMQFDSTSQDVEKIISQIERQNIDITNGYNNWLNIGFGFANSFNENGREFFHRISKFHPEYNIADCNKQFDECLKNRKQGITISTFFGISKAFGISTKQENNIGVFQHEKNVTVENDATEKESLKFEPTIHNEILTRLIDQIEPINFREQAGFTNDKDKLSKKHFLISSIKNVLEIANRNNWCICQNLNFVYLYNGAYWKVLDSMELQTFFGEAAEKMGIDKFDAQHYQFREELLKQFFATSNLPKPLPQKDIVLINLKNGTFEISPDKQFLRTPNPKDFITYQLPFEYNSNSEMPLFQTYLNRVQPDVERQKILAEYLGYIFIRTSTLKLEKTLLLYGTGANGKSVFFDVINALLGKENVCSYSLHKLTENDSYRANLANKLLNYASEINGRLQAGIFKQLVSGEPVEAKILYSQPFTMTDYAKLIFNCNELPKDVEQTHAFFRRFLIIPFEITIPDNEQDSQLALKIIQNELAGVFNWLLAGLNRLLAQKRFTDSEAVNKQIEQYKKQSDTVQMFLEEENYIKAINDFVPLKQLYNEYRNYCNDNGNKICSNHTFSERLKNVGLAIERKNIGRIVFIKKNLF